MENDSEVYIYNGLYFIKDSLYDSSFGTFLAECI